MSSNKGKNNIDLQKRAVLALFFCFLIIPSLTHAADDLVNVAQGKPVSLIAPTVESSQYCLQRGYTKDKLTDGITREDWYQEAGQTKRSLAYPGDMWLESIQASISFLTMPLTCKLVMI